MPQTIKIKKHIFFVMFTAKTILDSDKHFVYENSVGLDFQAKSMLCIGFKDNVTLISIEA